VFLQYKIEFQYYKEKPTTKLCIPRKDCGPSL